MRVVLIGSKGQLGSDISAIVPENIDLFCFDRENLDITKKHTVEKNLAYIKPNIIINASAYTDVNAAENNPAPAFGLNAVAVMNLVSVSLELSAKLIHISTDYIFDGKYKDSPYLEDDAPNPLNIYGLSKLAGEYIVRNYMDSYYVIRTAGLYGKSGARGKGGSNLVFSILDKARKNQVLELYDDIVFSINKTMKQV